MEIRVMNMTAYRAPLLSEILWNFWINLLIQTRLQNSLTLASNKLMLTYYESDVEI